MYADVGNTAEGGRGQHYSCRCGWIDTGHATSKRGFINKVLNIRQSQPDPYWSSWVDFSDHRPTNILDGNITLKQMRNYFEVDTQAIVSDEDAYEVALGMYIAVENMFETTQGYRVFELSQSSFSEEDLVSDLIGFHIGIGQITQDANHDSLDDFMKLCEVVGYEIGFDKTSPNYNPSVYKQIQERIYLDYVSENGGFRKYYHWGRRPPGRWRGSVNPNLPNCNLLKCGDQDQLPDRLTSITPKSPGDGWRWLGANIDIMIYGQFWVSNQPLRLNWAPVDQ